MPTCPSCGCTFTTGARKAPATDSPYRAGRTVPEWSASDWPTRVMREEDARATFKAHATEGDLTFYLQLPYLPRDVRLQLSDLLLRYRAGERLPRDCASRVLQAWRSRQTPEERFGPQPEGYAEPATVCPVVWDSAEPMPDAVAAAAAVYFDVAHLTYHAVVQDRERYRRLQETGTGRALLAYLASTSPQVAR